MVNAPPGAGASRSPRSRPPSSDPAASAARNHQKEIAGAAAPLGCHPQWIKSTTAPAGKSEREDTGDPSRRRRKPVAATPTPELRSGGQRRRNHQKEIAGAAAPLGCHPQWIKSTTAPAGKSRERTRRRPIGDQPANCCLAPYRPAGYWKPEKVGSAVHSSSTDRASSGRTRSALRAPL